MKRLEFIGDSKKALLGFPASARHKLGFELNAVQTGRPPSDSKPMPNVGAGVEEIRIWVEPGTFRAIYISRLPEAVYVLHAFQKKTQQTAQKDLDLAKKRLSELKARRSL